MAKSDNHIKDTSSGGIDFQHHYGYIWINHYYTTSSTTPYIHNGDGLDNGSGTNIITGGDKHHFRNYIQLVLYTVI